MGQVIDATFFVKTIVHSRKIALWQWENDRICQLFDIFLMVFEKLTTEDLQKLNIKHLVSILHKTEIKIIRQ